MQLDVIVEVQCNQRNVFAFVVVACSTVVVVVVVVAVYLSIYLASYLSICVPASLKTKLDFLNF